MDPYVYPGTDVLRNRRNLRDPGQLSEFEALMTARRAAELQVRPSQGTFDGPHVQMIHRHLFQDVYEWAGQVRTINISRGGWLPRFPCAASRAMEEISST